MANELRNSKLHGVAGKTTTRTRAYWTRVRLYGGGKRLSVVQLLRGIALHEHISVVEGVEVNLDDVGAGVVDPHDTERRSHH